jgi:hypothetical protein
MESPTGLPGPRSPVPGPSDEARAAAHDAERARHLQRAERLSWLRVLIFLVGLALAALGLAAAGPGLALFAGALVVVVGVFTAVARAQRAAERRAEWHGALAGVCREALLRRDRAWERLPVTPAPPPDPSHPYAGDVDVFGRASLLQLLGPVGASTGAATLARWLLAPAAPVVVRERQAAVAELAGLRDVREELAARARLAGRARPADVARFLAWAEDDPWLGEQPVLRAVRWVVPATWLVIGALVAAKLAPAALLGVAILVGAVGMALARPAQRRLGAAAPGSDAFRLFADQLARAGRPSLTPPARRRIHALCAGSGTPAAIELRRLRRVLDAAELRYSPMLHGAVNLVTAWDLHVLARLERWRAGGGRRARAWFEALGELEALGAFGTLLAENADWCLPELCDDATVYEGEALGHPLLAPGACVRNDVVVGPPGTFLFVTGSNMAGKSTLLRSIGANAVLAQAGAPVFARRLVLPPVRLLTCMRVSDTLEAVLSFFMDELVRLRGVVEAARDAARDGAGEAGAPRALYLLDEILQGTNSAERQVAARRVLGHLLEVGAIGAVSTHDLALADAPALAAAARPVHFREQLDGDAAAPRMTFDYVLRAGPATSANALRLVEMMGLG